MKQRTLPLETVVCAYCGGEALYSKINKRWYHVDWTSWRRGQPKESREHAFKCEATNYNLVVVTEAEFRLNLVEKKLDRRF